jgi:hypothetical protein
VDGTFTASRGSGNSVILQFAGEDSWTAEFAAAGSAPLTVGTYTGAVRYPFQPANSNGMSISGAGRGCNTLTGRFAVLEAVYTAGGAVQSFAADYEQHCENAAPALFGSVRYNSTIPLTPHLFVGTASIAEGNSGTTTLNFPVWLSEPQATAVSVSYATADGTATGGSDYASASGTLNFPAGALNATVPVLVQGDTLFEADETFAVVLSNPSGASLGIDHGTGTILNDDSMPALSVGDTSAAEGDPGRPGTAQFTVSLSTVSGQPVCFNYATLQGTALAGVDFVNTFGSTCLPAGTTTFPLNVPLVGDLDHEADESFSLSLSAVTGATVAHGQATGTILNDDNPNDYYTLTPCRLLDTRQTGPGVAANTASNFAVAGLCGVPLTAKAVLVNITVVSPTDTGDLRLYAAGSPAPLAAVLAFTSGRTLAGNAVGALGAGGSLAVQNDMPAGSTGHAQVVVDVYGYFQ